VVEAQKKENSRCGGKRQRADRMYEVAAARYARTSVARPQRMVETKSRVFCCCPIRSEQKVRYAIRITTRVSLEFHVPSNQAAASCPEYTLASQKNATRARMPLEKPAPLVPARRVPTVA